MGTPVDLTNHVFGRLTVIRLSERDSGGRGIWLCRCECGQEASIRAGALTRKSGNTTSCGCYRSDASSAANTVHGHTKNRSYTKEFRAWSNARDRCHNPKNACYRLYSSRGITMCQQWRDSFQPFFDHIGPIPTDGQKHSLDRIDNDKGYEPGNVRWTGPTTQANNKSNNVMLTAFGKTMTLPQWSRESGLSKLAIRNRVLAGWPHERAVSEPLGHKGNRAAPKYEPFNWCG